jgi:DNA-directed RNA polymerase subunit RPC12/RpoP
VAKYDVNKASVDIKCPGCKHVISKPLGWFQTSGAKCPECSAKFDGSELAKVTKQVNNAVESLQKTIKNASRKLGGK